MRVPAATQSARLVGRLNPAQVMNISVSIPLPKEKLSQLQAFVDDVSDPHSPNYRKFISPEEVGLRFGPTKATTDSVVSYLKGKGFKITLVAKSGTGILAQGTAAQAEKAFGTVLNRYRRSVPDWKGQTDFYSFAKPLKVVDKIAPMILHVGGLDTSYTPRPRALTPSQTRQLYKISTLYNNGRRGEGRTVGITNFDGFRLSNLPLFYSTFGLPTPSSGQVGSNVSVVTVGTGSGSGTPEGEGDLDIQCVLAAAPLCNLTVYDGTDLAAVLLKEQNDNTADIITESYGHKPNPSLVNASHTIHLQMSAQGITYMCASGDYGTDLKGFTYPDFDPEVLMVGGTVATVDSAGNRLAEDGWSKADTPGDFGGSGGGYLLDDFSFNVLPVYQKGPGVPTSINRRLFPDVALHADGPNRTGAYQIIFNGQIGEFSGTSAASPTFAGGLAVAEQELIARGAMPITNGRPRFGRIQDLIYSQQGRSDVWFDVTTGDIGPLPDGTEAVGGPNWDFVTGWGAIDFNAFVSSIQVPGTSTSTSYAPTLTVISGTSGIGSASGLLSSGDGATYSLQSGRIRGLGQLAAVRLDYNVAVAGQTTTDASFNFAASSALGITGQIYFYNWSTGAYELYQAFPMNTSASVFSIPLFAAGYVNSNGDVRVLVRALKPTRLGSMPLTFTIDQASVTATTFVAGS